MSNTHQPHRKYRPDIDGLRAIAIVSVIAYHAGIPGFSGGFVGVDIFFVISGFLITALLFNEVVKTGWVNLGAFYARRVRRLMPAGLVVVAATLLVGAFVFAPASDEQRSLARSAIDFSYLGSNFYFFRATGGYFDAPSFSLASVAFYTGMRGYAEGLAIGGLALIVYSIVALDHNTPFPGSVAMLPVFGSAAQIVGMSANERGFVRRLLASKPMVFIGLLSYSWYLWHWPLLSVYKIYNLGVQNVAANALLVLVALLLAWLTYLLVENPIRVWRPGPFRSIRPTLLAGLCIILTTLVMGNVLKWWSEYQKKFGFVWADCLGEGRLFAILGEVPARRLKAVWRVAT